MSTTLTREQIRELQTWNKIQKRIISFENKFSMHLSHEVFKEYGEKLFLHFRNDCDNKYEKFKTYLTTEQYNSLLEFIILDIRFR